MATRSARSTTVSVRPRECAVAAAAFEADQPPRPDFALQEGRVAFTFQALGAAQVYSVDVENGVGELLTGQVSIARYPELVLEPAPDFRDSFAVQRARGHAGLGVDEFGEGLLFGEEQGLRGVGIGDGGLAVQDIRHPFAEFLGDLGSRQHRQQVATAQGENADLLLAAVGVQFDQRGHGVGEFV